MALIETAAVISRLTNNAKSAEDSVSFLRGNCRWILYDATILDEAIYKDCGGKFINSCYIPLVHETQFTTLEKERADALEVAAQEDQEA